MKINKNLVYPSLISGGFMLAPLAALAQSTTLITVVNNIVTILNVVVTIVFILAVVIFGWGIVKLIAAAGDAAKIQQAKQFIWWGVIGIVILASIGGLIRYLQGFFGVDAGSAIIDTPVIQ